MTGGRVRALRLLSALREIEVAEKERGLAELRHAADALDRDLSACARDIEVERERASEHATATLDAAPYLSRMRDTQRRVATKLDDARARRDDAEAQRMALKRDARMLEMAADRNAARDRAEAERRETQEAGDRALLLHAYRRAASAT